MKSRNPVLPVDVCCPDSEPHFVNGELYVYPSLDVEPGFYCTNRLIVPHSANLSDWTIGGTAFDTSQLDWDIAMPMPAGLEDASSYDELPAYLREGIPEEARKSLPFGEFKARVEKEVRAHYVNDKSRRLLYAPDSMTVGGRSCLFFCTSDGLEGVAFSDRPEGPFTDPVMITGDSSGRPIQGIDPGVFMDDDGRAYLYWGQINSMGAELTEDFTQIREDTLVKGLLTEREHGFHEGSSMRKIGDTYYYIFADTHRGRPTALGYATSRSPLGPFTYRGVIVDNLGCDPETWNNHGSIECVNGQWYVFYHRSSGNSRCMRRLCAEPIYLDQNGLFAEVPVTSIGMGEPYTVGEPLYGYQACQVQNAYIDGEVIVAQSGESEIVYRYIDRDADFTGVELDGDGEAELDYTMSAQGELVITLRAEEPVRIRSFMLRK